MQIAGFIKTSLIEWPGKISSVIFTLGCNFRCPFCHNADLVDSLKFKKETLLTEEKVLSELKSRKDWNEAVVVTGGEPTLQKDLKEFLSKIKKIGFKIMLQTNGTNPLVVKDLLKKKLVDYFSMDLKGDLDSYEKYVNCQSQKENIKNNLEIIAQSGIDFEFRTTVTPGLHDQKNLQRLANQIKKIFTDCKLPIENCHWYLQQFRPINTFDKNFLKIKPFQEEQMKIFQKEMQKIVPLTFLRGI